MATGDYFAAGSDLIGSALSFIGGQQALGLQSAQYNTNRILQEQQLAFQQAAAHNGVRWRVEDAKAAGISPLVALGMQPYNPGGPQTMVGDFTNPYEGAATGLGRMGQDISRAIGKTQTAEEREAAAMTVAEHKARMDKMGADTELTRAQTASVLARMPWNEAAFPSVGGRGGGLAGQGNAGALGRAEIKPNEVITTHPGGANAPTAAGPAMPQVQWARTGDGLQAFPTKLGGLDDFDAGNQLGWDWWIRNRMAPNVFGGAASNPPPMELVKHHFPNATGVTWNISKQQWEPLYSGSKDWEGRLREKVDAYTSWRDREFTRDNLEYFFRSGLWRKALPFPWMRQ